MLFVLMYMSVISLKLLRKFYEIAFRLLIQALRQFSGLVTKVAFNHLGDELPKITD